MKIADRIERLGVETAFAVSAEAAAFAAEGNKVYPFHLGDMNMITPSNIMDAAEKAMRGGRQAIVRTRGYRNCVSCWLMMSANHMGSIMPWKMCPSSRAESRS